MEIVRFEDKVISALVVYQQAEAGGHVASELPQGLVWTARFQNNRAEAGCPAGELRKNKVAVLCGGAFDVEADPFAFRRLKLGHHYERDGWEDFLHPFDYEVDDGLGS
jgi:hypothetical protein